MLCYNPPYLRPLLILSKVLREVDGLLQCEKK